MQEAEEQRGRRSQRDDSLARKLAVVGEVARGEPSKKQAKPRYGIQGRSTGLVWGRKDAPPFAPCKPAGYISSGAPLAVEQPPEQRSKQLLRQLREQKQQDEQQLQHEQEKTR